MKTLLQPYFLILLSLSSTVYLFQITSTKIPQVVNNYFNDLVCLPIVLTICLCSVRIIKRNNIIALNSYEVVSVFILYSILFELVFPTFLERYTCDYWDILMYFLGSCIFYILWNKPITHI